MSVYIFAIPPSKTPRRGELEGIEVLSKFSKFSHGRSRPFRNMYSQLSPETVYLDSSRLRGSLERNFPGDYGTRYYISQFSQLSILLKCLICDDIVKQIMIRRTSK